MKRIAVIADIHSNLFALEAVIEDLEKQQVDEIIVAGDLVGRGPQGSAVVRRIQGLGWPCIRGNHEDYVINFYKGKIPEDWKTSEEWSAARWMGDEMDEETIEFIDALPMTMTSSLEPDLRLYHGSPNAYNEGIGSWTQEEQLSDYIDAIEENLLVCAHTHRPWSYESAQGMIVNVGSVGLPFNGDTRAQYAIFHREDGRWQVEFRQVDYDRSSFLAYYKTSGFLEAGGFTSRLLVMELEHARPFLVPFLFMTKVKEMEAHEKNIGAFLDVYDCTQPMKVFFEYLNQDASQKLDAFSKPNLYKKKV